VSDETTTKPFANAGASGPMIRLALVNILLSIATLSIWRFWGRTKVRRLLWGGTTAWGDPVEYVGTGKELFTGFLLALLVIYLPLGVLWTWAQTLVVGQDPMGAVMISVLYPLTMFLISMGLFRARRYQLSRTVWRGIRGGQTGSALVYAGLSMLVWVLVPLSLGWALPWGEMKLARYRLSHTTFGDKALVCGAKAGPLYRPFLGLWLVGLAAPLLGSLALWALMAVGGSVAMVLGTPVAVIAAILLLGRLWVGYRVAFYRSLAEGTAFEGARFGAAIQMGPLFRLWFGNMLISVLSLGILRPWAALRVFRFTCARLEVTGEPDFEAVRQSTQANPKMGEGLVTVLDGVGEF
jgi:uncharacterized membrane protein YjgN (DUF898 family)